MAKRLSDTGIWNKDWYQELSIKQKLLVKFLFDNCDCAGIYEISWRNLKNCFNEEIKKEDFEGIKQVKFINENTIFIEDFIKFQYNVNFDELNEKNNVHKGILKSLRKYNIFPTLPQPLVNPYPRVLDKDKVKVKDKDKESKEDLQEEKKESKKEKKEEVEGVNPDIYVNGFKEYFEIYRELCPDLIKLTYEPRNRECIDNVHRFANETNSDLEYFKSLCQKGNELKTIVNNPIDFNILIAKHIRIMNGFYQKGKTGGQTDRKAAIEAALKKSKKWRDVVT